MKARFGLACALWLAVSPLSAQYIAPGSSEPGGHVLHRDDLAKSYDEARWHLGGLRLAPWLGLRDVSFVTFQDAQGHDQTDFTVTAGLGLRAYARTGPRIFWAAHLLPEYVAWADAAEKRQLNGRYGLGLFAFFNRLDVEAWVQRQQRQAFFSSEVQELTSSRSDTAHLAVELELGSRLSLLGLSEHTELASQEPENPIFGRLDRSQKTYRLMLYYEPRQALRFGAGWEELDDDFAEGARSLSSARRGARLEAAYSGRRFAASLTVRDESVDPEPGAVIPALDVTTGGAELQWQLRRAVSLFNYFRRDLRYSVSEAFTAFTAERYGARLDLGVAESQLGFFVELGEDDYLALAAAGPDRLDEIRSYGLTLQWRIRRRAGVVLYVTRTKYDSNLDVSDREVTLFNAVLNLGELLEKFRLGQADRVW